MRQATMATGMAFAAALLAASPASAQTGAPNGTPMQAGAWGARGWQAGGAMPADPAPVARQSATGARAATPVRAAGAGYTTPSDAAAPYAVPAYGTPGYAAPGYAPPASPAARYASDPAAYRRRPLERGQKLKGAWRSPIYTVHDWRRYGLPAPGPGMRWSRYQDDAVLVDARDRVVDARGDLDWNGTRRAAVAAARPAGPVVYPAPTVRRTVERVGGSIVTTETRTETVPPSVDLAAYGPGATFTPGTRTTVTTTTETARGGGARRRGAWGRR